MAATITQAILARFATSTITDFSASGGLWLEEAPEQASLPLIGFTHGGERPEYTTEEAYNDVGSIDFDIYAVTVEETERLALLVLNLFDLCIKNPRRLDFTGGLVISWERTNYRIGVEGFRREDNKQIGHATFSYSYTTKKSLPT
jgi:hypothetical protein